MTKPDSEFIEAFDWAVIRLASYVPVSASQSRLLFGTVSLLTRDRPRPVSGQGVESHRIGAAAEAEQEDLVAIFELLGNKPISAKDIVIEAIAGGEAKHSLGILLQPHPGVMASNRANSRIVVDVLMLVLLSDTEQLEDVGEIALDLLAGAVAADNDVLAHANSSWPEDGVTDQLSEVGPASGRGPDSGVNVARGVAPDFRLVR